MALTKVSYSMIQGALANVLDYGAVGDGVTDDTAAFLLADAVGATVYVPPSKTFLLSQSATFKSSFEFPETAKIKVTGTGTFIIFEKDIFAGRYKIFDQPKVRAVVNSNTSSSYIITRTAEIYAEWWGARVYNGPQSGYTGYAVSATAGSNVYGVTCTSGDIREFGDWQVGDQVFIVGVGASAGSAPTGLAAPTYTPGGTASTFKIAAVTSDWGITVPSAGLTINHGAVDVDNPLVLTWNLLTDPTVTAYIIYINDQAVKYVFGHGGFQPGENTTTITDLGIYAGTQAAITIAVQPGAGLYPEDGLAVLPNGFPRGIYMNITAVSANSITTDVAATRSNANTCLLYPDSKWGFEGAANCMHYYSLASSLWGLNAQVPRISLNAGNYYISSVALKGLIDIFGDNKNYVGATEFTPVEYGTQCFTLGGDLSANACAATFRGLAYRGSFQWGALNTAFVRSERTGNINSIYFDQCRAYGNGKFYHLFRGVDTEVNDCVFDSFVGEIIRSDHDGAEVRMHGNYIHNACCAYFGAVNMLDFYDNHVDIRADNFILQAKEYFGSYTGILNIYSFGPDGYVSAKNNSFYQLGAGTSIAPFLFEGSVDGVTFDIDTNTYSKTIKTPIIDRRVYTSTGVNFTLLDNATAKATYFGSAFPSGAFTIISGNVGISTASFRLKLSVNGQNSGAAATANTTQVYEILIGTQEGTATYPTQQTITKVSELKAYGNNATNAFDVALAFGSNGTGIAPLTDWELDITVTPGAGMATVDIFNVNVQITDVKPWDSAPLRLKMFQ